MVFLLKEIFLLTIVTSALALPWGSYGKALITVFLLFSLYFLSRNATWTVTRVLSRDRAHVYLVLRDYESDHKCSLAASIFIEFQKFNVLILCLAHFKYELDFDMDVFSFWKCIESSIQDIAELAPYLPVGKVSEQKQNIFKIKMFS